MALKILGMGCTTAAGASLDDFWKGLVSGQDHSEIQENHRVCLWKNRQASFSLDRLCDQLLLATRQIEIKDLDVLGVIFASTKGAIEDAVSKKTHFETDTLTPVLEKFLLRAELPCKEKIVISNACSSVVAALFLAQEWIKQKRVKQVLVISADEVSPFVSRGFSALRALTSTQAKPFSKDRDGLQLGEAATALLVGDEKTQSDLSIEGIGLDVEGHSITRPSRSGESLLRAIRQALSGEKPNAILAHGTGTQANDEVEDHVFTKAFGENLIPITCAKWSVGHTLGASAGLDLIAASLILKHQKLFKMAHTYDIDPQFKNNYLSADQDLPSSKIKSVLVSSLGFGGVHGALYLKRDFQ